MGIILITGGARSGKSTFAQKMASEKAVGLEKKTSVVYVATALIGDEEMLRRVEIHRRSRPPDWMTIEEPYYLDRVLDKLPSSEQVVLVDCLTVWLTNLLFLYLEKAEISWSNKKNNWRLEENLWHEKAATLQEEALEKYIFNQVEQLLEKAGQVNGTVILVSNEVGWGVVPEHYLGRLFRDLAGKANQRIAARADEVYLVVAGIPLKIRG
jgi:adenosylcobinamide kinase/adenosylcobinamide-phosphate guanylyltransferase